MDDKNRRSACCQRLIKTGTKCLEKQEWMARIPFLQMVEDDSLAVKLSLSERNDF